MVAVATSLLAVSCSKEAVQPSGDAIGFFLDMPTTRATIFETPAGLQNPAIGGADFACYAYVAGNGSNGGKCHINNVRVNYFADAKDWRFTDPEGMYVHYYWPLGEKLHFFGHMPYKPADGAVTSVGYTHGKGPEFSYSLPLCSDDQDNLHEFIYAYTENQDIETQNADVDNPGVKMVFMHPFAGIRFHLRQAYRMRIHSITVSNLEYEGSYVYDGEWTHSTEKKTGDLFIYIEKDVPDPINYDSPIGGTYLVAPQTLDDKVRMTITFTRLDGETETKSGKLSSAAGAWEAGKIYTYTVDLGKTEEEILFEVKVDKWDVHSYKNEITVE